MATNYVKARYQEVYDFGTMSGRTTILGIHAPTGGRVQNLLGGFFNQFKKFRYKGCSVTMIPAAQLPADPLQVSYEAGGLTVDPRDLLNPILFHGCHGESLNIILNEYLSNFNSDPNNSVTEVRPPTNKTEEAYYAALSDPSFRKFGIQQGAKVSLHPMVHPLAMTNPMAPNTGMTSYKQFISQQQGTKFLDVKGQKTGTFWDVDVEPQNDFETGLLTGDDNLPVGGLANPFFSAPYYADDSQTPTPLSGEWGFSPVMFTNGLRPLGWLDTSQLPPSKGLGLNTKSGAGSTTMDFSSSTIGATRLPKIFMGIFILPPSYTQEMYFRLIINHYFEFKDFTTCLNVAAAMTPTGAYTETIPEPSTGGSGKAKASEEATSLEVVDGSVNLTTDGVY